MGPLKQLVRKQIVKIIEKTILVPLPAAPKELLTQARTITLNEDQQKALDHLDRQIENRQFAVIVLHGVTDSGKRRSISHIEKVLAAGRQAIVLLPEIALTTQTISVSALGLSESP